MSPFPKASSARRSAYASRAHVRVFQLSPTLDMATWRGREMILRSGRRLLHVLLLVRRKRFVRFYRSINLNDAQFSHFPLGATFELEEQHQPSESLPRTSKTCSCLYTASRSPDSRDRARAQSSPALRFVTDHYTRHQTSDRPLHTYVYQPLPTVPPHPQPSPARLEFPP